MKLHFVIPGIPQAKQRARVNALLQCMTCGRKTVQKTCPVCGIESNMRYLTNIGMTPVATKNYEALVAMCARDAMHKSRTPVFVGPVAVFCRCWFPVAATRAKKLKTEDWHGQRPDGDNVKKSILDGMLGVVYNDDCSVSLMLIAKNWTHERTEVEVTVESLEGRTLVSVLGDWFRMESNRATRSAEIEVEPLP